MAHHNNEVKEGMKINIGDPINQYDFRWEIHNILSVEQNPNNSVVPFSILTCCGKYIPTSGADGHWEKSIQLGGWDIMNNDKCSYCNYNLTYRKKCPNGACTGDFINSKGYKNKDEVEI